MLYADTEDRTPYNDAHAHEPYKLVHAYSLQGMEFGWLGVDPEMQIMLYHEDKLFAARLPPASFSVPGMFHRTKINSYTSKNLHNVDISGSSWCRGYIYWVTFWMIVLFPC